jgi:hypothetical protein
VTEALGVDAVLERLRTCIADIEAQRSEFPPQNGSALN